MRYKCKIIGLLVILVLFLCILLKKNNLAIPVTDENEKEEAPSALEK